jgi:hypothetical protein
MYKLDAWILVNTELKTPAERLEGTLSSKSRTSMGWSPEKSPFSPNRNLISDVINFRHELVM